MQKKTIVLGKNGFLGSNFLKSGSICLDKKSCDITNQSSIIKAINKYKPEIIINCVGYTGIQRCQDYPFEAYDVNVYGTYCLIRECVKNGIKLVSFDSVHSGIYGNVYSMTKFLSSELIRLLHKDHLIIKISTLFDNENKQCFVRKVRESLSGGKRIDIFTKELITPTYAKDIVDYVNNHLGLSGEIKLGNSGSCTRLDFAFCIANMLDKKLNYQLVERSISVKQDLTCNDGIQLRCWEESLQECLN